MALCLKKLKNLAKVKLIDASFLWTEPHSKRIKVKLAIQVIKILKIISSSYKLVDQIYFNLI